MPLSAERHLLNVRPTTRPKRVKTASQHTIVSTKTGVLDLPSLPEPCRVVDLFPDISEPLLSIPVFCDNGLTVTFDAKQVKLTDSEDTVVLTGTRDSRGMYMLPLTVPLPQTTCKPITLADPTGAANLSIFALNSNARTVAQRVSFLSKSLGNPADSTLIQAAIETHLKSVPNLTAAQIKQYAPNSIESAKGHLDLARQGVWSTQVSKKKLRQIRKRSMSHSNTMVAHTVDEDKLADHITVHADPTGPYPIVSRKGNRKLLISYSEHGNAIHATAMKGDAEAHLITAYDEHVKHWNSKLGPKGCVTDVFRLDNQTSAALERHMREVAKVTFQYVAPGNHRTLHAERDIRTYKNHLIATRAGVDKDFPKDLWDELLPHTTMTLNILRPCLVAPNTSAWDYLHGTWDYMKHPIGPAGSKVLVYESPEHRSSFADHGVEGFYLGSAPDHYRCHRVYIPSTRDFRVSDTLSWHLSDPFGLLSNHTPDDALECALDLLATAKHNAETASAKALLQESIHLLSNYRPSINSDTNAGPIARVSEPAIPTTGSIPRVVSTQQLIPAAIPRVIPTTTMETPATIVKRSHGLRTNKNHVYTDPSPVVHAADKIISHKGSTKNPLRPLRFRTRWLGYEAKDDTYEPLENIKDCQAFKDYVLKHKTLLYLCPSLSAQLATSAHYALDPTYNDCAYANILNTSSASLTDEQDPLSNFEMYELLNMPYSDSMNAEMWVSFAAGDMDDEGNELKFKKCVTGPNKEHWIKADETEFHKLLRQHKVMYPKSFQDIPERKKPFVTYYNRQCKTKMKAGTIHYRVRGTFGGNKTSSYTGITASYQASMTTVKMLLNKTISDQDSKFMTMDITDMYLHTLLPSDQFEYMVIDLKDIPQSIIDEYHLLEFVSPGETKVYFEVVRALYGMKQAGYLANIDVVKLLNDNGYTAPFSTPCLFSHHTDDIDFTLITDDFGVRYGNKAAADKLLSVLSSKYPMTYDWDATKYAGFDLMFDYGPKNRRVELSMKGYVAAVLKRFRQIITPTHNVYSPEFFQPINYGSNDSQLVKEPDKTPPLPPDDINLIQQITGCMLYYTRGVDGTMLLAVDHISREQNNATETTMQRAIRLLEYAATFPNATIVYYPSDMILMSNVDGSYNSEPDARSRAAAFHYLGRLNDPDFINGPIECLTGILPTVVASAAETEYASLFIGGKSLLPLRYTLADLQCPQPSTVIVTDNIAAQSIANNTCKQRRSKSIDMRYHWIRDRVNQKDFKIIWRPGDDSIADFLTKTQPGAKVLQMRHYYVKTCPPTFPVPQGKRKYLAA